jgi:hypothetical protein
MMTSGNVARPNQDLRGAAAQRMRKPHCAGLANTVGWLRRAGGVAANDVSEDDWSKPDAGASLGEAKPVAIAAAHRWVTPALMKLAICVVHG